MGIGLEREEKDGNREKKNQTTDGRNKVEEEGDRHREKTEIGRGRQMEKGGRQRKGSKWDRERGVRGVHPPTPKVLGKKPEA